MTRPRRIWNTWTTAPAGPTCRPKASRSPSRPWRSSAGDRASARDRAERVAQVAASSNRSAAAAASIRDRSVEASSSLRPSRKRRASSTAARIPRGCTASSTHGAMHRLISYSRHGRPRLPVISSLHERIPNSRCVSAIVRRARLAGRNGPAYTLPSRSTRRATSTRGTRLARRQLQVGVVLVVAEQDVVLRLPLLDQVVLERERLDHRVGHDHLEGGRLLEQGVGLRAGAAGSQVAADPVPQGPGLAHVDRLASGGSKRDRRPVARAAVRSGP